MITLDYTEKKVVDTKTGQEMKPECFIDLAGYIGYIEGRGHREYAQHLLRRVLNGDKIITRMIECMQKRGICTCDI